MQDEVLYKCRLLLFEDPARVAMTTVLPLHSNPCYYTPLSLNLANKRASKEQASTCLFRFGYCSASSLRAVLYSSPPRA